MEWLCLQSLCCNRYPTVLSESVFRHFLQLSWNSFYLWQPLQFPHQLQQVNTYAFCSWDDIFTQKRNCSSPNNLCKCTESPSTLSTSTSKKWKLYLSRSNHLVTSFRLEMNIGGFFEHQNNASDTDRYNKLFSPLVSFKSMWILWKEVLSIDPNCRLLNDW